MTQVHNIATKQKVQILHARIQRWWGNRGFGLPPLKNHRKLGFLSNTGPELLKNHKATKSAFNVGPTSAFRYRAIIDGPSLVVFGSSLTSSTKTNAVKVGLPLTKLSGSTHTLLSGKSTNFAYVCMSTLSNH